MLTNQDMKEMHYAQMGYQKEPPKPPQILFSLNVQVTEEDISLSSAFPGGKFSASGNTETIVEFLSSVWPQIEQGLKKCASSMKEKE